ncbi:hypothetical protein SDC9_05964 [bioreactor metagenome]|uniref:Uncharacterized protein n=1 Tax=bioreactor metagenome TaxID=1076179 RepID=A0A644T0G7_9ZZZZ
MTKDEFINKVQPEFEKLKNDKGEINMILEV